MTYKIFIKNKALTIVLGASLGMGITGQIKPASAQIDMAQKPVLVITNKSMTPSNSAPISTRPSAAPVITPEQIADAAFSAGGSMATDKINGLNKDVFALQNSVNRLSNQLANLDNKDKNIAASYHANVATINTALQTGTTPGNPRLMKNLSTAQNNLDTLAGNITALNSMGSEIAQAASKGAFLLESIRNTYNLTGAVEEDHAKLAQLEDQANASLATVDRLLNEVNDSITRTTAYVGTERNNLRTLSLAVSNGDLYGRSLANHPFSAAPQTNLMQPASYGGMPAPMANGMAPMAAPAVMAAPGGAMPLAKIRFDKPDVNYEQPIYAAVQNAMQKYPNGRFELVAVHPTMGNAAQVAIESTRARRNAERVLRTLSQMGIPLEQVDMSYTPDPNARSSEVHLYLR